MGIQSTRNHRAAERRRLLEQLDNELPEIVEILRWNIERRSNHQNRIKSSICWLPSTYASLAGDRVLRKKVLAAVRKTYPRARHVKADYVSMYRGEIGAVITFFPALTR